MGFDDAICYFDGPVVITSDIQQYNFKYKRHTNFADIVSKLFNVIGYFYISYIGYSINKKRSLEYQWSTNDFSVLVFKSLAI